MQKLCIQTLLVITLVIVVIGVWSLFCYGNFTDGVVYLRGDIVSINPSSGNVGEVKTGSDVIYEFKIRNLTGTELQILGVKTECQCVVASDLPASLAPRQYHLLQVKLSIPKDASLGPFEHHFLLYLNVNSRAVVLKLNGTAVKL